MFQSEHHLREKEKEAWDSIHSIISRFEKSHSSDQFTRMLRALSTDTFYGAFPSRRHAIWLENFQREIDSHLNKTAPENTEKLLRLLHDSFLAYGQATDIFEKLFGYNRPFFPPTETNEVRMAGCDLVKDIKEAKSQFGGACNKFCGAVTIERLRSALLEQHLVTSQRDCFLKGLPIELDLLVCDPRSEPKWRICYAPKDVVAVIEVKNAGSFGQATIDKVKADAERIRTIAPHVKCCYVTISERRNFRWAVTRENSGCHVYTLSWHNGSAKNYKSEQTEDFCRLIKDLKQWTDEHVDMPLAP